MRNALAHAAPKQRPAVIAMIKTIFAQETAEAAHQQWEQVADALREKFPKLADMMDASREDVLAYMTFPKDHWAQIASTNPLERVNKEIKRRADVIGIFPNDAAVVRLVGALMLEQNDEWAVSRRYMTLETLGSVSHNPVVSLPACHGCLTRTQSCRGSTVPTPPPGTRPAPSVFEMSEEFQFCLIRPGIWMDGTVQHHELWIPRIEARPME